MITKETAMKIYNCHQQIGKIDAIKADMLAEVEKQRERASQSDKPLSDNPFGKYGTGLQIGVPNGLSSSIPKSMQIF